MAGLGERLWRRMGLHAYLAVNGILTVYRWFSGKTRVRSNMRLSLRMLW
jgi:hypothetical protein